MKEEGEAMAETKKKLNLNFGSVEELKEYLARPRTEEELEAFKEAGREADRVRVKVGRDFNVAREIRKMRDEAEGIDS